MDSDEILLEQTFICSIKNEKNQSNKKTELLKVRFFYLKAVNYCVFGDKEVEYGINLDNSKTLM